MSAQITAALIGLALAGSILYLVRRDQLHGPYALWWLIVAAATLLLGFVPRTIDWLAHLTGIAYPPVLPLIIGVSLILLRLLQLDIERSRQERQIRRLNQKLAILEEELATLHKAQRAKAAKSPA